MRFRTQIATALLMVSFCAATTRAQEPQIRTVFRVKYVAEGAVYLDGGRAAGLSEGLKLTIKRNTPSTVPSGTSEVVAPRIVAQLQVTSVAESSAVCEILSSNDQVQVGDLAALSPEDVQMMLQQRALGGSRRYLQVITFSEAEDPLEEEVRESIPKPPLPEINRKRGRIGFEYSMTSSQGGAAFRNMQAGLVLRMDMTRLGGTYWNFSGYTRVRLNSRSGGSQAETLSDLINRTYHLSFTYSNPASHWVMGFGRLYVPWASSLNTIDGGYFGRRFGRTATAGVFAGSTPDPTSWNYNPERRLAGAFANFEGGSFDSFRYASTFGIGLSSIRWRLERPFAFFENSFFYKRYLSVYQSLEADRRRPPTSTGNSITGVSRSYLTVRMQPHPRVSFDVNHNYFRDVPTFDPRLVSTGLVDKLLFQGFSGGARVELPYRVALSASLGRSSRTGDARSSWNQMYGVTLGEIWRTGIRADLRYSKFDSSFGRGSYRSVLFSRGFAESLRLDVQTGWQALRSQQTQQSNSWFVGTTLDWSPATHYFLESGFTIERGVLQDYNRFFVVMGYRF